MIVITGADGQLGTAFAELLPDAVPLGRGELDVAGADAPEVMDGLSPSAIINCAAFTGVDDAEDREPDANLVNGQAVGRLARYAAEASIPFVSFSTDYVFSGDREDPYVESDPVAPLNAYGRSKALGEKLVADCCPDALIVRTSWLISGTHDNFVSAILNAIGLKAAELEAGRERSQVSVVADQTGCPTVAADLAKATVAAMDAGVTGVLHLVNQGVTTWFDLARSAAQAAGADPACVVPCASTDYPTKARRPRFSVLGSERLGPLSLPHLPHWRDSLGAVVAGQLER